MRYRSPPRQRSPMRIRSPPRQRSPMRTRSPPRQRSPLRIRSPPRHKSRSPLRMRSPPRERPPIRARTPPRSHRSPRRRSPVIQEHSRGRRHSPSYLPSPPPPPRHHSPERQGSHTRYHSPRHHRSRSPRRLSPPLYPTTEKYRREFSPPAAPRVPRDQRTPPRIQPPRPKHLRSPRREEGGEKHKPSSSSSSGSSGSSRAKSDDRKSKVEKERRGQSHSELPATAPPPPSISSPQSSSSSSHNYFSSSTAGTSWAVFRGPEHDDIDIKELKKIQIDIRRSLPHPARSDEPVIRKLGEQQKLVIPRKADEGRTPLFHREDIKANAVPEEKPEKREQKIQIKVAPLEEYERRLGGEIADHQEEKREREESPRSETRDVRARLGDRESSWETASPPERRDVRERLGLSIKDRLGEQLREEEAEFRPWGGPRHYRGGRRGRGRGYRGGRARGSRSEDWKYHDKFQEEELPSSTTD